jgi:hypothetical protein
MSAKTEKLLEQINRYKNTIREMEEQGEDPHSIKIQLEKALNELNAANKVLSESVTILKG